MTDWLGHFGFSYMGLIYLLLLFIPNLLWAKHPPAGYRSGGENRVLLVLERAGEALTTAAALLFSDFNPGPLTPWSLWLAASLLLMLLYELYWLRYFRGPHSLEDFYRPFLGVPVPGASLPVAAFLLLGIYGRVIGMLLAALVLGVGDIGVHLQHWRELRER